jgi:hypothetical protein
VSGLLVLVLAMPLCAMVAGAMVWLMHRRESLEDSDLLLNFLITFGVCFGLVWSISRTEPVRMRLDPAFRIKTEIEANAVFRTVNAVDESGTGKALRRSLEAQMIAGVSLSDALARERPLLSEGARYRFAFADQLTQLMWAEYVADTLKELQQQDPELCYRMMWGGARDAHAGGGAFSAEKTKAFHAVLIRLYEAADRGMRRERFATDVRTDLAEGRREFVAIKEELIQRYGLAVATAVTGKQFGDEPPGSAATMCRARISQLDAILRRPQGLAAMLARDALT